MMGNVFKLSELWPYGVVLLLEIGDVYRSKTFKKLINKYTLCFYAAFSIFVIRKLVFFYFIDKPGTLFFVMDLLFAVPFAFLFIYYGFYRMIPLLLSLCKKDKELLRYQKELNESSRVFWFVLAVTLIHIIPRISSLWIFFKVKA